VATRRLAKPRPVQGKQVPPVGGPPRDRVAAQRDGHQKQNPAYRPATEKALETGLFLWTRFAGDSSGSPRGGPTAVYMGTARRGRPAWSRGPCLLRAVPPGEGTTSIGVSRVVSGLTRCDGPLRARRPSRQRQAPATGRTPNGFGRRGPFPRGRSGTWRREIMSGAACPSPTTPRTAARSWP
jgi:hypothetical protein